MTKQEISRYIAVASKWEEQYATARIAVDMMKERVRKHEMLIDTLESQLKIQDTAIERKDAEIIKLNKFNKYYVNFCVALGYLSGFVMAWWLL